MANLRNLVEMIKQNYDRSAARGVRRQHKAMSDEELRAQTWLI